MTLHKFIYHKIINPLQIRKMVETLLKLDGETILDIGYRDKRLFNRIFKRFDYYGIDNNPIEEIERGKKVMIEDFKTKKKWDIVCAIALLEHVKDPVKVIKKIRKLAKKYIFIAIPYEPYYTISRFFKPEEEHYWTIHPNILEYYLGKPILEKFFHFKRAYLAVYKNEEKNK